MKELITHNICFLGQTGFGKTSLINAIFSTSFNTDPLVSCTRELYSVTTLIKNNREERLVSVFDTPGIGEFSSNSKYQLYYELAVSQADHIVLVVTLDRTDATSQDLLESLKPFLKDKNVKFTIALNRIDSTGVANSKDYVAWDASSNNPSKPCQIKIEERKKTIKENFGENSGLDFLPFEIVPVCAIRNFGLETLKQRLL